VTLSSNVSHTGVKTFTSFELVIHLFTLKEGIKRYKQLQVEAHRKVFRSRKTSTQQFLNLHEK
jgi:hypothetical protein